MRRHSTVTDFIAQGISSQINGLFILPLFIFELSLNTSNLFMVIIPLACMHLKCTTTTFILFIWWQFGTQ